MGREVGSRFGRARFWGGDAASLVVAILGGFEFYAIQEGFGKASLVEMIVRHMYGVDNFSGYSMIIMR